MKKIIILLLCCGLLIGMVGCGGNTAPPPTESPPTTISETMITETPTETIPPKYTYMAVGVMHDGYYWYVCVCMDSENTDLK